MTRRALSSTVALTLALAILSISMLLTVVRVILGPTLPDRVLALDMLVAIAIGFIAVLGIRTGQTLYADIAIALGLVGFLATMAFARFILAAPIDRGRIGRMIDVVQNYLAADAGRCRLDLCADGIDRAAAAAGPLHAHARGLEGRDGWLVRHADRTGGLCRRSRRDRACLGGVFFFLLTAPVSAHLLARAAHASGLALWQHSVVDDYARPVPPRDAQAPVLR